MARRLPSCHQKEMVNTLTLCSSYAPHADPVIEFFKSMGKATPAPTKVKQETNAKQNRPPLHASPHSAAAAEGGGSRGEYARGSAWERWLKTSGASQFYPSSSEASNVGTGAFSGSGSDHSGGNDVGQQTV